jgi:hypothetical protein
MSDATEMMSSLFGGNFEKMMKDMHINSDSEDEDYEMKTKKIRIEKPDRTKRCSGCYPIFQMNQEGHMGINGCLSDRM